MVVSTAAIEIALAETPSWALLGLAAPGERLREVARREVAACLAASLNEVERPSRDQLRLPL